MSSIALRLSGWKAVVLLVGLGLLVAARYVREHELPHVARETIMLRLKADQSGQVFAALGTGPKDKAGLARMASELERAQNITIDHATTRGILWPKYVRVVTSVNGRPPADGRTVRFFTIDWAGTAQAEVTGTRYYLSFW